MLTRPTRLEAAVDKYSTKWHQVKGRYASLFVPSHIEHVERWYNTIAPVKHRDAFRTVMKGVLNADPNANRPVAEVDACKIENILRLYGESLSELGKRHAAAWLLHCATHQQIDAFRDVFTGVQSLFTVQSHFKSTFKYRPLPDIEDKAAHRQKIDWSNTHAIEKLQKQFVERAGTAPHATDGPQQLAERRGKAGSAMGHKEAEEQIATLKAKRVQYQQSDKYNVDPVTGCSVFTATTGSPRRDANSKSRVMATFQAEGTHGWISTTREMIRNYGTKVLPVERVRADQHPAIALTTASVGLCVPGGCTNEPKLRPTIHVGVHA